MAVSNYSQDNVYDDIEVTKAQATHIETGYEGSEDEFDQEPNKGPHMDTSRVDKDVLKYVSDERIFIDEATNTRLKRKIDRRLVPAMIITYLFQCLDKGTLSFASIMGIKQELNMVGQDYAWLTTITYIAVLVTEPLANILAQKLRLGKYLGVSIILWSTVLCCMAAVKTWPQMMALRFLLGAFETPVQPIFLTIGSMWYRREEQAGTISIWYGMNGGQQIIGGVLAYCFTLIKGAALFNWQILFLTYGLLSIAFGFFVLWYFPDSPMTCHCFSEEDKKLMIERVRENQTGLRNKKIRKEQLWEGLRDPQMYLYFIVLFCTALPTSGLGAFAGIIISSFGFTVLQTQLLAMVLGTYILIVLFSSAYIVTKTKQNLITMVSYIIPSIIATVVMMTVKNDGTTARRAGLLCCYYLALSFWATTTVGMSVMSRNVAGQTKKPLGNVIALFGSMSGNAIGPQVFLNREANASPAYKTAWATHLACYALMIICITACRFYFIRENKKKDALIESGEAEYDENLVHAFDDITDKENAMFRYVY